MLTEKFLLDDYYEFGKTFDGLKELIGELKAVTTFQKVSSKDLSLLSYLGYSEDLDKMYFFKNDPDTVEFIKDYICEQLMLCGVNLNDVDFEDVKNRFEVSRKKMINSFKMSKVLDRGDFKDLIKEVKNTKLMVSDGSSLVFTSGRFLATAERFGLKGNFLTRPTINRDSAIEKQLTDEFPCTLVIKEFNGIKKAFSLLSGKYQPIDQEVIFRIIKAISKDESLGDAVCRKWEVTNFLTSVFVEFPKKAEELQSYYGLSEKFIPGLWIATSDTGNCSLKIRGTWRRGDSITYEKEISKKHLGEIDITKIMKEVENTIFAEYSKLPERLCELMLQEITEPEWDLSTAADRFKNTERIRDIVKNVFEQVDMLKAIGRKNRNLLYEQYLEEFDPEMKYTAYDIAVGIMEFPNRLKVSNKEEFMRVCGLAPYVKYEAKAEEEIILL